MAASTAATGRNGCRTTLQYLDGTWVPAADGATFEDLDPFSGRPYASVPASSGEDARRAVAAAARAFPSWSSSAPRERQRLFLAAAAVTERRFEEIVSLLALETGAARPFAAFQVQWAVGFLRLAAAWPHEQTGTTIPLDAPRTTARVSRRPLGVVAGFSPWNGAFNLAWRTVAPPLACGNTVVLKPSELAPVAAGVVVAEIAEEAGFPSGVLNVVTHAPGAAGPIGEALFAAEEVQAVNFTGSTRTGRMLAERAGRALKRIVLELGGFNPTIVLADADLDDAVETAAFGAFFHQGQICMSTRKLVVEQPIFEELTARLVDKARTLRVGDPSDASTQLGPLIDDSAASGAERRLEEAVAKGAKVLTGGTAEGRLFPPTVVVSVPPEASLYCEETFAPIVAVEPVADAEEAIAVANAHAYGLTASILTRDLARAEHIAAGLRAGVININGPTMYAEPIMPIGGVRASGWARFGLWSAEQFSDRVTVTVHDGPPHLRL